MAEEIRLCHTCNKDRPKDAFRASEGAAKEFYKLCEDCRTKYRNRSRFKRAQGNTQGNRGRSRPYYLAKPAPRTIPDVSNSQTGLTSEGISAAPTTTVHGQATGSHADPSQHSWVTVAPPVIESSAQSTTTTTVITISTTTKNMMETTTEPEEDKETAHDGIQRGDEDLESLSTEPEYEQQSEISVGPNQRPEFFGCMHCEKLRPWPMAGLHICLLCIRDWKWCAKGAHNHAKASFLWDGKEHDECYMCHFADI
ncbi:hypothetical protein DTO013E5_7784 [Penicillium roqueforti]|nr:hypothetical protein CBS147337_4217 [Penicillium roqueforti]KAI2676507.1 hypothetical protein CBS147355_5609 [Penicillium roqueforti]KAI2702822.1 hypothetical protein CBS147372_3137 [Penicillium roqueforti]KAI2711112.1 hypothetical protein CBS147354_8416 [Penicillium roqueforti]KAI2737179.1 hypothetical protein DTO012A1_7807 [Penicillium roqueforti]